MHFTRICLAALVSAASATVGENPFGYLVGSTGKKVEKIEKVQENTESKSERDVETIQKANQEAKNLRASAPVAMPCWY